MAASVGSATRESRLRSHRDRVLALMGHDLRNRFAAIQTGLSLLERYGGQPQSSAVLERISRQVAETVEWLEDLVRVARGGAGSAGARANESWVEVVQHALARTAPGRSSRGQTLELVDVEDDAPMPQPGPLLQGLLGLVFVGASLRSPRDGILRVSIETAPPWASVTVEIHGRTRPSPNARGLHSPEGLELLIVRDVAEELGGRLEQVEGDGTGTLRARLRLELPVAI